MTTPRPRAPGCEDPLDALHAAWSSLPAPEATPDLADEDERTAATVAWLQDAWRRLEAPASQPPRQARPRIGWHRHAAAAAVLLAFVLALRGGPSTGIPTGGGPLAGTTTDARTQGPAEAPARTSSSRSRDDDAARLVAVHDDALEWRAGSVRLLLVTTHPTPPREGADQPPPPR